MVEYVPNKEEKIESGGYKILLILGGVFSVRTLPCFVTIRECEVNRHPEWYLFYDTTYDTP